ncbi:MAG TPA: nuclear transport factor 2 family protein [Acidobacteriaceae bacterium]|jgi:hypothetical protein
MRVPLIAIATLLLTSSSGASGLGSGQQLPSAQAPPISTSPHAVEALRVLEANYLRAEMEDDANVANSILAEDFVGVRGDGTVSGREDVLNNLSKHERSREPYRITATNMREYVFGDAACVTYTKVYTLPNNRTPYSENVMHIFMLKGGNWRLQVSSPIPRPTR